MNDANEKTQMNRRHTIMTIANFASRAPKAYELLHRIGLDRRRSRAIRLASCAGWIGVGMAVGGGLVLLLTPEAVPRCANDSVSRASARKTTS
jgi:hypothetical protein